ncbi:hypothetical protein [Lichenihabitans psoromatis]|uniref:hypothetical protein n=1 Tax=Lichenihabitans psoromatis TaxID=2528642 RepID=UPI001036ADEF|nr:hypothetical protein [Lichenihabitans psoromatis]
MASTIDSLWISFRTAILLAGFVALAATFVAFAGPVGAMDATAPIAPPAQTDTRPATAPASGCDAACVRLNTDHAAQLCAPLIEAQSPTDFDWLNRPVPGIFQQAEPPEGRDFTVRYRGDVIRFQTPDRDWIRMSYECAYNVETRKVMFLNLRPGRLAAQKTSVVVATILPLPVHVQPVPQIMAQQQTAPMPGTHGSQLPTQRFVQQQPAKRLPPAVGEPSPIEIQQQMPRVRP